MDGRHLYRLKAEQSHALGSGAGGADRFGQKARAGEGGGLGGPGQSDSCLAAGRSSSRICWLASELAELSDDNQTMDVASDQEPAPLSMTTTTPEVPTTTCSPLSTTRSS